MGLWRSASAQTCSGISQFPKTGSPAISCRDLWDVRATIGIFADWAVQREIWAYLNGLSEFLFRKSLADPRSHSCPIEDPVDPPEAHCHHVMESDRPVSRPAPIDLP
jgi:hypothetical protein